MAYDYHKAALIMLDRGWLAMPLALDPNGFPKRPIVKDWAALDRSKEIVDSFPWAQAKGLGIVLGIASSGLAVIDIDDPELAELVFWALAEKDGPRMVRTIRKRGHIYVQETAGGASRSRRVPCLWKGKPLDIELKAEGNQVAAPPTPGYEMVGTGVCLETPTLDEAWDSLRWVIGLHTKDLELAPAADAGQAGYPPAWQETVKEGNRNKALYIEAHRLRQSGMPFEQALSVMQARVTTGFEGSVDTKEMEATVRSAYRKGVPLQMTLEGPDELHLLG